MYFGYAFTYLQNIIMNIPFFSKILTVLAICCCYVCNGQNAPAWESLSLFPYENYNHMYVVDRYIIFDQNKRFMVFDTQTDSMVINTSQFEHRNIINLKIGDRYLFLEEDPIHTYLPWYQRIYHVFSSETGEFEINGTSEVMNGDWIQISDYQNGIIGRDIFVSTYRYHSFIDQFSSAYRRLYNATKDKSCIIPYATYPYANLKAVGDYIYRTVPIYNPQTQTYDISSSGYIDFDNCSLIPSELPESGGNLYRYKEQELYRVGGFSDSTLIYHRLIGQPLWQVQYLDLSGVSNMYERDGWLYYLTTDKIFRATISDPGNMDIFYSAEPGDVISYINIKPSNIVIHTDLLGLIYSTDEGNSWQRLNDMVQINQPVTMQDAGPQLFARIGNHAVTIDEIDGTIDTLDLIDGYPIANMFGDIYQIAQTIAGEFFIRSGTAAPWGPLTVPGIAVATDGTRIYSRTSWTPAIFHRTEGINGPSTDYFRPIFENQNDGILTEFLPHGDTLTVVFSYPDSIQLRYSFDDGFHYSTFTFSRPDWPHIQQPYRFAPDGQFIYFGDTTRFIDNFRFEDPPYTYAPDGYVDYFNRYIDHHNSDNHNKYKPAPLTWSDNLLLVSMSHGLYISDDFGHFFSLLSTPFSHSNFRSYQSGSNIATEVSVHHAPHQARIFGDYIYASGEQGFYRLHLDSIQVQLYTSPSSNISGYAFRDNNENCSRNVLEQGVADISISFNGQSTITDENGFYSFWVYPRSGMIQVQSSIDELELICQDNLLVPPIEQRQMIERDIAYYDSDIWIPELPDHDTNAGLVPILYPNPAKTTLFLRLPNGETPDTMVLHDEFGRTVFEGDFQSELDVSTLNPGKYFLGVGSNDDYQWNYFIKVE